MSRAALRSSVREVEVSVGAKGGKPSAPVRSGGEICADAEGGKSSAAVGKEGGVGADTEGGESSVPAGSVRGDRGMRLTMVASVCTCRLGTGSP